MIITVIDSLDVITEIVKKSGRKYQMAKKKKEYEKVNKDAHKRYETLSDSEITNHIRTSS